MKLVPLFAGAMLLSACGQSRFGGSSKLPLGPQATPDCRDCKPTGTPSSDAIAATPENQNTTETHVVARRAQSPVDVVWLIDTSGSMANELAHVKKNFASFVSKIKGAGNVRVALVARGSSSTQASLPPSSAASDKDFAFSATEVASYGLDAFINLFVGSTDALYHAARVLCPSQGTIEGTQLCGKPYLGRGEFTSARIVGSGSLATFVRPGAKLALVLVSDDDARGVDDSNFEAFLAQGGVSVPRIFGFVGTRQSKCSISRPGDAYAHLNGRVGGALFDICATSWHAHFAQLTDAVQTLARAKVTLKRAPVEVVTVNLDGVSLPQGTFKVTGADIEFALPPGGAISATVHIDYR